MTFFPIPLTVFQAAFRRSHPAFPFPSPSGQATLLAPGVFTAGPFQSQTLSQLPAHRELGPGSPHAWSHVKVPAGSHGPATRPPEPSCPDRQRRKGRKVRNSRGNTEKEEEELCGARSDIACTNAGAEEMWEGRSGREKVVCVNHTHTPTSTAPVLLRVGRGV